MRFDTGTDPITPILHEWGELIPTPLIPTDPTKQYHIFDGWWTSDDTRFNFTTMPMPIGGVILTAKWEEIKFVISFVTNSDEDLHVNPVTVYPYTNDMLNHRPRDPAKKGHDFAGWWTHPGTNGNWGTQVHFVNTESPPDTNITLYARWTVKQYTVTYDYHYGTHEDITAHVTWGQTFNLSRPIREHYHFQGWFTLDGTQLTNTWGSSDGRTWNIDSDTTLRAHWVGVQYTMRFEYDDGRPSTSITHAYGELIPGTMRPHPLREFATFVGWETPEKELFNFETTGMPANINLTARWAVDVTRLQTLVNELTGYEDFKGFKQAPFQTFLNALHEANVVLRPDTVRTITGTKTAHDNLLSAAIALSIADADTHIITPVHLFELPATSSSAWLFILLGSILLLAAAAAGGWLFWWKKREQKD
jgi:uncharacterized repeat protein (TIGR02543 family)